MPFLPVDYDKIPGMGKLLRHYLKSDDYPDFFNDKSVHDYFKNTIERKTDFKFRTSLNAVLENQNKNLKLSDSSKKNIAKLKNENCFCITTGHQLSLAGGPLFVSYKILSAISLSQRLKKILPEYDFVPVFWMASEDHDKEEINHFYHHSTKLTWETAATGAVGEFKTNGITELLNSIPEMNDSLRNILVESYTANTLSEATRRLMNALFGPYGLVIIDGNDKELKSQLVGIVEKEIREKIAYHSVKNTNEKLATKGFEPLIDPRELNLFLLDKNDRKRLVFEANTIQTVDGKFSMPIDDFITFCKSTPEKISPNVLLRPIYQETILPNIAYFGGPSELEYWLQLDELFSATKTPIPARLLRTSVTHLTEKSVEQIKSSGLPVELFFQSDYSLGDEFYKRNSDSVIDFSKVKLEIESIYNTVSEQSDAIDKTLTPSVKAELQKSLKGLEHLEGKLRKAEKAKMDVEINRLLKVRKQIFPMENSLQERVLTILDLQFTDVDQYFEAIINDADFTRHQIHS